MSAVTRRAMAITLGERDVDAPVRVGIGQAVAKPRMAAVTMTGAFRMGIDLEEVPARG